MVVSYFFLYNDNEIELTSINFRNKIRNDKKDCIEKLKVALR
jgi:hypothetical protein